jgi:hypothetical protein
MGRLKELRIIVDRELLSVARQSKGRSTLRILPSLFIVFLSALFMLDAATFAAGASGARAPYGDNPAAGAYIQVDGARIYYESYGEGRPIFFFHGGGAEVGCKK